MWSGAVIELRDKKQPALVYVWYPEHLYEQGTSNEIFNGRRECRVYDQQNEILKQVCRDATGKERRDGATYWEVIFPK